MRNCDLQPILEAVINYSLPFNIFVILSDVSPLMLIIKIYETLHTWMLIWSLPANSHPITRGYFKAIANCRSGYVLLAVALLFIGVTFVYLLY